ncbi:hypothetical protein [Methylorubrum populi]|nr:hypothetical protein [Methylorubrum populi]
MDQHQISVELGNSNATSSQDASELREFINQIAVRHGLDKQIGIDIIKDRTDTQDFGATLAILFGTPAAIAIAKGIHDFIAKSGSRVTINHKNGTVIAVGDPAKNIDIAAVVKYLQGLSDDRPQ